MASVPAAGAASPAREAGRWSLRLPLLLSLAGLPLALFFARFELPLHGDLNLRSPAGEINGYLGRDFVNTWTGAKLAWSGHLQALFEPAGYAAALKAFFGIDFVPPLVWSYPPAFLLLVAPLALLAYVPALAAYMGGTGAAFLAATAAQETEPAGWRLLPALACSPAAIDTLCFGQNGFLVAALLIGGIGLVRMRPAIGGALLGALIVKPHLGLVVPFLLFGFKSWRALVAAGASALALGGASMLAFGIDPWREFLDVTVPLQANYLRDLDGPFATMMLSVYSSALRLAGAFEIAVCAQVFAAAAALGALVYVVRRSGDGPLSILAAAAAQLLATPYVLEHDLAALTAGIGLYVVSRPTLGRAELGLMLLGWIAAPLTRILDVAGLPLVPLIVAALLGLAVYRSKEPASPWTLRSFARPGRRNAI